MLWQLASGRWWAILLLVIVLCFTAPFWRRWSSFFIQKMQERERLIEYEAHKKQQQKLIAELHAREAEERAFQEKLANMPPAPPPPTPIIPPEQR